ncbi:MAG: hypothetical protein HYX43_15700 [Burkholderiales bacterium]|nr:hypothetical protein [Burkholderiales bacterium]
MRSLLALLAIASTLTACGGGGSGGSSATANATKAEGVYEGSSSTGYALNILVLENDEAYALYGTMSNGTLYVSGFNWGQGSSSNGTYTGSTFKDYFYTGAVTTGTLNASYVANTSFNGTVKVNGTSVGFTSSPPTSTTYNYNTAASVATISGSWTGTTLFGETGTLAVTSNGSLTASFTGSYVGTCSATGTVSPRASGKNLYDVSITFGAAPCALSGQAANGIAVSYLLNNGKRQLVTAVTSTDKAHGSVFFAAR